MIAVSSTALDHLQWFSQLRRKRLPYLYDVPLDQVCADCRRDKRMEEWKTCTHIGVKTGSNSDRRKRNQVAELSINQEDGDRENFNIQGRGITGAFHLEDIEALFNPNNYLTRIDRVRGIVIGIDMAAGGANYLAVTAAYMIGRQQFSFGWIDYWNVQSGDVQRPIIRSIQSIAKNLRGSEYKIPILLAVEANGRNDGETIQAEINQRKYTVPDLQNIVTIRDIRGSREFYGVLCLRDQKKDMTNHFTTLLETGNISIWHKFGTNHESKDTGVLKEFENEMSAFRKSDYSGKRGKQQDDVMLAALTTIHWGTVFFENPDYENQRKEHGL